MASKIQILEDEIRRLSLTLSIIRYHGFTNGLGLTCAEIADEVLGQGSKFPADLQIQKGGE